MGKIKADKLFFSFLTLKNNVVVACIGMEESLQQVPMFH